MCLLTAGSLKGAAALPLTTGQTATPGKKTLPVCFLISDLKSLLILAFLQCHSSSLARLNLKTWQGSCCSSVSFNEATVVFEKLEKCIQCMGGMNHGCNILPVSCKVVIAVLTVKAGLCLMCSWTVNTYIRGWNGTTSFTFSLWIHSWMLSKCNAIKVPYDLQ